MQTQRATLLCRYQYDPLDRLTTCTLSVAQSVQRFYLKNRWVTEVEGQLQRSIVQYQDLLLGQIAQSNGVVDATLLASNQQRSVLNALGAKRPSNSFAYAPYGYRSLGSGSPGLPGFNGEEPDRVTGHYLLGNGYRGFNPVLMRFNSPDSLSPFGKGGINAYVYCSGDPVNREDSTGHIWKVLKPGLRRLGLIRKSKSPTVKTQEFSNSNKPSQADSPNTRDASAPDHKAATNLGGHPGRGQTSAPAPNQSYSGNTPDGFTDSVVMVGRRGEVQRMDVSEDALMKIKMEIPLLYKSNRNLDSAVVTEKIRSIGGLHTLKEGDHYIISVRPKLV